MGAIIQALIGFLGGGVGQSVGRGIANVTAIAALTPIALWGLEHKEEVAVALTWGQLALFGGFAFVIIKVVHYTRSPAPWVGRPGE